jgi:isocitrate dehydrogenase (NAD+)
MMLRHLGLQPYAQRIQEAALAVIGEGKSRTPDLGGSATTTEYTDAIIARLK